MVQDKTEALVKALTQELEQLKALNDTMSEIKIDADTSVKYNDNTHQYDVITKTGKSTDVWQSFSIEKDNSGISGAQKAAQTILKENVKNTYQPFSNLNTAMVDDIINQFSKEQQKSLKGNELRERYKKRAGKDVSNITGANKNIVGTTRGKLLELDREARKKGYKLALNKEGKDTIVAAFVPIDDVAQGASVNWQEPQYAHVKIKVGSNGRIGNRVNKPLLETEYVNKRGQLIPQIMLETAETAQLTPVIQYIKGQKFGNDGRTAKEMSKLMQTLANKEINQSVPLDKKAYNRKEAIDVNLDDLDVVGKLSENEAKQSVEYHNRKIVHGILSNPKTKEAIINYYKTYHQNYNTDKIDFDNPSKSLTNAIIDAFTISGIGIDQARLDATPKDKLLKYILTDDAFKYLRADAQKIIGIVGDDNTGISEGKHQLGIHGVTSSLDYSFGGKLVDRSQRSLTQAYNSLNLTEAAKEARQKLMKTNSFTTERAQEAGIDYSDEKHMTGVLASITAEKYDELQKDYYSKYFDTNIKEQYTNKTQDELAQIKKTWVNEQLLSLEDKILGGADFKAVQESLQFGTISNLTPEQIGDELLKQAKISRDELQSGKYDVDSVIDLKGYQITGHEDFAKELGIKAGSKADKLVKDVEGWKLIVENYRELAEGTKTASFVGARTTTELNEDKLNFMKQSLGLGANVLGITQQTDINQRKYGPEFIGQLQYILDAGIDTMGSAQAVQDTLKKDFPILASMFKVVDNKFVDKIQIDSTTGGMYSLDDAGNRIDLFADEEKTEKEFSNLRGAAKLLNVELNEEANLLRTAINQHNIYPYQDPTGYGKEGRIRNDFKVRHAQKRNIHFYGEAVKNGTHNKSVQRGVDSLITQQEAIDEQITETTKRAQEQRAALKESYKSLDKGYTPQAGDVELVTKASLGGQAPKPNQIVIDDKSNSVDFHNQLENGRLTQDQYGEFVMTKARALLSTLKAQGIANENSKIVLDASSSVEGGKKVVLGDIAGSVGVEGKIMPSETDKWASTLFKAVLSENSQEWEDAIDEVKTNINYATDNKNSELFDRATHNFIPYSTFSILAGLSSNELNPQQANTVFMSPQRYRAMRHTEDGASRDSRITNVKGLFNEFKTRSSKLFDTIANDKDAYKAIDVSNIDKLSTDDIMGLEDRIIELIITDIQHGNSNYTMRAGRYPYTQGKEGNLHRIGIKTGIGDTLQMSQGMLRSYRGDTDGDNVRAALAVYQQYGEDEFAAEQAMLKYYDEYALNMNKIATAKKESAPEYDKIAAMLKDPTITTQGAEEAKRAFEEIGYFSNTATNARESMDLLKFGTDAINNPIEAFQADVIRAFLEQLEQDAISSKKLIDRLAQNKLDAGEDVDSAVASAYKEVEDISIAFNQGDYAKALQLSQDYGVFKEIKGGKQFDSVRAAWMATNPDFVESISKQYGLTNFAELDATDATGVTADLILESFEALAGKLSGNQTMEQVFTGKLFRNVLPNGDKVADRTYPATITSKQPGEKFTNTADGIVIDGNAQIVINGEASINGSVTTAQAAPQPTNNIQKQEDLIADMFDEYGKLRTITSLSRGNLNTNDGKHEYTFIDENGNIVSSSNSKLAFTTPTSAFGKLHAPMNPFNFGAQKESAFGTLVHSNLEATFGGDVNLQDVESKYFGAFDKGGAGNLAKTEDLELAKLKAALISQVAKQFISEGDTLLTEHSLGLKVGDQYIGEQADMFNIHRNANGSYETSIYDWKVSKGGSELDEATRGKWALQMSSYGIGARAEVEGALASMTDESDKISQQAQDVMNRYKISAKDSKEAIQELSNFLASLQEGKIILRNFRSFTDNGAERVEVVESRNLSDVETLAAINESNHGRGVNFTNAAASAQSHTTGYYALTEEGGIQSVARPDFIEKGLKGTSAKETNKAIAQRLQYEKELLKINNQIHQWESGYSGGSSYANEAIAAAQSEKDILQSKIQALDLSNLSAEEQKELEQELLSLQNKSVMSMGSMNSSYEHRLGLLQQIEATSRNILGSIIGYGPAAAVITQITKSFKEVIQYATELDKKLVDLQIATGNTKTQTYEMLAQYNSLAKELGRTTTAVADAANDWLRAGYEGKEATDLITSSMQLSTLGMMSASDATSALISVLKGWKLESNEVANVVDRLVAVDMQAAVNF